MAILISARNNTYYILILLCCGANLGYAQSATTQQLHKQHDDAFYLYFYKNTLQMINQDNNEEFAKLIDNIEKMKFLRIDKKKKELDLQKVVSKYQKETFEELMSMRKEDKDIKILIKEKDKVTLGLVMLISDQDALSILDIKGSVPFNQLTSLYDKVRMIN